MGWSPRVGVYQAFREINNKTDGVDDHLLPITTLRFAYLDSKCDGSYGLDGALRLTNQAFGGKGVNAIIGAGCSSASVPAALVSDSLHVPIISPSSLSTTLSDGQSYPYFLRTPPSDDFVNTGLVEVIQRLFNYTAVALAHSTDEYGSAGGRAFASAAAAAQPAQLEVTTTVTFTLGASDLRTQHRVLLESGSRVIVLIAQNFDGSNFMTSGLAAGVGGEGFLFLSGDSTYADKSHQSIEDDALHRRIFHGFFAMDPSNGQGTPRHDTYLARRHQLPPMVEANGTCSVETDDNSGFLWMQDHDNNASTPMRCSGDDPKREASYDAFGYDAAFAVAHALHDIIHVQNRTEVVGSELLEALIKRVRFTGVTGLVDFYDASEDADRLYDGDRREGFAYTLKNYVADGVRRGATHPQGGFVTVGSWSPCPQASSSCGWSDYRWQPVSGVELTFSTADNSRPPQAAPRVLSEVRVGVLLPMFKTAAAGSGVVSWSPRVGAYQALQEINNKSDG
eukprot:5142048-Prymnesium_polylepis.1